MHIVRAVRVMRSLAFIGACFGLTFLMGCGGGDAKKATISGKVTYKGAPLAGGTLKLVPTSGGSSYPVYIKPDGAFQVTDAPVGNMQVAIESTGSGTGATTDSTKMAPPAGGGRPVATPAPSNGPVIPARYNNPKTSGLTWDVKAGRNSEKTFDLTQ
jgi:hypothetical protein